MSSKFTQIATTLAKQAVSGAVAGGVSGLMSRIRSKGLPEGGEVKQQVTTQTATWGGEIDWRVRLSLPEKFKTSPVLKPLCDTGNCFVFPFTPQITLSHSAKYTPSNVVHTNYPFLSYENSKVDEFTITGDFYCKNDADALYWCAAVHYFRSITKMGYGDAGSPPPVVKLNGYGSYVFNDVPVVVTKFSVDMSKDVDYISTTGQKSDNKDSPGSTYAPSKSTFTISLQPIYSREQVRKFSLTNFINGDYILGKDGGGYI